MRSAVPRPAWMLLPALLSAAAGAQTTLFEDYFEVGSPLSWTSATSDVKHPLEAGGFLLVRDGAFEPGTIFDVTPVPSPLLPDGLVGVGQAYEVTTIPPPRFPLTVTLPIVPGRGPDDLEVIVTHGDEVTIVDTDRGTVGAIQVLVGEFFGSEEERTVLIGGPSGGEIPPRVEIGGLEIFPPYVGVSEPVTANVSWASQAQAVRVFWGDGSSETDFPTTDDRDWSFLYSYSAPGIYVVRARVTDANLAGRQVETLSFAKVFADPRGDWSSSFGAIHMKRAASRVEGTFVPSEHGLITGDLTGRTLEGFWVETVSARECDFDMLDSEGESTNNWGRVRFDFNEDYTQFCGNWG